MSDDAKSAPTDPRERESTSFAQRLTRLTMNDLLRLFFICVLVGLILAAFSIDPRDLWADFFGTIAESWSRFISVIADSTVKALEYFLLGAVIVIPIWLFFRILGAIRKN